MARILIVDDDPDIVEAVQLCLANEGYEVVSASNREDGMRLAGEGTVDLLILDVMMTEFDDGIVMARELRKNGFEKPILMMSGISKVTGMSYGRDDEMTPVDDFIEKPVAPGMLIGKVSMLLQRAGQEDAS